MELKNNNVIVLAAALIAVFALVRLKSSGCSESSYKAMLAVLLGGAILFVLYQQFNKRTAEQSPQKNVQGTDKLATKETENSQGDQSEEKYTNYDMLQGHYAGLAQMQPLPRSSLSRPQDKPAMSQVDSVMPPVVQAQVPSNTKPNSSKTIKGNFLDVTSKDVDVHSVVSNKALIPVMEQYMKIHENDPTRNITMQSSHGLPFYDTRDPVNVTINEFPSSISAKLPIA